MQAPKKPSQSKEVSTLYRVMYAPTQPAIQPWQSSASSSSRNDQLVPSNFFWSPRVKCISAQQASEILCESVELRLYELEWQMLEWLPVRHRATLLFLLIFLAEQSLSCRSVRSLACIDLLYLQWLEFNLKYSDFQRALKVGRMTLAKLATLKKQHRCR